MTSLVLQHLFAWSRHFFSILPGKTQSTSVKTLLFNWPEVHPNSVANEILTEAPAIIKTTKNSIIWNVFITNQFYECPHPEVWEASQHLLVCSKHLFWITPGIIHSTSVKTLLSSCVELQPGSVARVSLVFAVKQTSVIKNAKMKIIFFIIFWLGDLTINTNHTQCSFIAPKVISQKNNFSAYGNKQLTPYCSSNALNTQTTFFSKFQFVLPAL